MTATTTELQHVDYPHEPGRLHDCPACESRCHCRPGEAECVFEGEHVDRRVAEAEAYVRTRFYPPLPHEYGAYAVQAIDACNEGDMRREIRLDRKLPIHPRRAIFYGDYGPVEISAEDLIDALRLWHLVEDPETEHDCAEYAVECGTSPQGNGAVEVWDECEICHRQSNHRHDSVL